MASQAAAELPELAKKRTASGDEKISSAKMAVVKGDLADFFRAVWADWLARMAGLGSVIFALLGAIGPSPLPPWSFWVAAAAFLSVTSFRVWQKPHRLLLELQLPRLEIRFIPQSLPYFMLSPAVRLFRVGVVNMSGKTVDGVQADLVKMEPQPRELGSLPLPLATMHHVSGPLDPGDERFFDVCQQPLDRPQLLEVCHTINHLWHGVPLCEYHVKIRAHGRDASCEKTFRIRIDNGAGLLFEPL